VSERQQVDWTAVLSVDWRDRELAQVVRLLRELYEASGDPIGTDRVAEYREVVARVEAFLDKHVEEVQ
jgi:hypothetical protein